MRLLIALILSSIITLYVNGYMVPNYCCMKCGKKHVMCRYKKDGPHANCTGFKRAKLTSYEREQALSALNYIKDNAAYGKYDNLRAYGRNFRKLEWDRELEMMAVRWAEQCGPKNYLDKCRDSIRFKVGQVVHYMPGGSRKVEEVIHYAFQHQKCHFTRVRAHIERYCLPNLGYPGKNVKNYAQLVWYENYLVGCGLLQTIKYSQLVCNFAPGVIKNDEQLGSWSLFKSQLCDSCPNGTYCQTPYNALCASGASSNYCLTFIINMVYVINLIISLYY